MITSSSSTLNYGIDTMLVVYCLLTQPHAQAAADFWSQTGGGSRLP